MNVKVKIRRFNPEKDRKPYWAEYTLDAQPSDRVLDLLVSIKENQDGTLTFRRSCAHGICGSDAMVINGRNRLACKVLVKDFGKHVTVEPLRGLPVIKSETAGLQAIMRNMPQVLNDVHETLRNIDKFLSEKNRGSVEDILSNVASITSRVDKRMDSIDKTLSNVEAASHELEGLLKALRPAGDDLSSAMAKFESTMNDINKVATAAAPGLEKFSRDGVDDFRRFMVDARIMVNSLNRLVQKMESDPRRFFFGQPLPEYDKH